MTRSDDTHENEANMTPEEMKNELRYLRAENAYLKAMQEHLLEKSARSWRKTKVIQSLRYGHCQSDLLKAAGLARSTLYYQLSLQKAKDKYADVKQLIASIFHEHRGCYGYRRIHCELQKRGLKFSGKTVRKLMQQLGLKSPVRLKKYRSYREIWDSLQKISFSDCSKRQLLREMGDRYHRIQGWRTKTVPVPDT